MNPLKKGQMQVEGYMWGVGAAQTPHIPLLAPFGLLFQWIPGIRSEASE
jgi:hypothetical protein